MKRLSLLILLLAIVSMPAIARADTVKLYDWTAAGNFVANGGNGGPFRAETSGSLLGTSSFMTFCIEYNEYFSYGTEYTFTLSDGARSGGGGAVNGYDSLSDATKWLYYKAVSPGDFTWYTLATGSPIDSNVGANIQYAIWGLEQEMTLDPNSAAGKIVTYATATNQQAEWSTLAAQGHNVYAMNLRSVTGGLVQDQLAYVAPVPDGGATLSLLAFALVGVGALRKRRG